MLEELITRDALQEVFFTGYSVGGNLVLKMAGELGPDAPWELRAVCAVSPCDLASCSNGSGLARNFLYEWHFLRGLRNTLEKKPKLFPELYHVEAMARVRTLREWHEAVTPRRVVTGMPPSTTKKRARFAWRGRSACLRSS